MRGNEPLAENIILISLLRFLCIAMFRNRTFVLATRLRVVNAKGTTAAAAGGNKECSYD